MQTPEYPKSKEIDALLNVEWKNGTVFPGLKVDAQLALFLHASLPFRYILWRQLDEDGQFTLFESASEWMAQTLGWMWRGRANRYWRNKVADEREGFIKGLYPTGLRHLWPFLKPQERTACFNPEHPDDEVELWRMLNPLTRLELWRWFSGEQRETTFQAMTPAERAELVELLDGQRHNLESISLEALDLRNPEADFKAVYLSLVEEGEFVTLELLAGKLGHCTQTVRRHAKKFGYRIYHGHVRPPKDKPTAFQF